MFPQIAFFALTIVHVSQFLSESRNFIVTSCQSDPFNFQSEKNQIQFIITNF